MNDVYYKKIKNELAKQEELCSDILASSHKVSQRQNMGLLILLLLLFKGAINSFITIAHKGL